MGGGEVARYMSRHGGRNVAQAALIASIVPFMNRTDDNPAGVDPSAFDQMIQGLSATGRAFSPTSFRAFTALGCFLTRSVKR